MITIVTLAQSPFVKWYDDGPKLRKPTPDELDIDFNLMLPHLKPGDWFEMRYGAKLRKMYVLNNVPELAFIKVNVPGLELGLSSHDIELDYSAMSFHKDSFKYLGRGRPKYPMLTALYDFFNSKLYWHRYHDPEPLDNLK